jgi:hypothetical protein
MNRLTMPDVGRVTLAAAIKSHAIVMAIGTGQLAWDPTPPDIDPTVTALTTPLAVVRPTVVDYVVPAANGAIQAADGSKWALSGTPTRYLYATFTLGFDDGAGATLRELALYLDPVIAAGVPVGQTYIPMASVTALGSLFALKRFAGQPRAGAVEVFGEIIAL